MAKEMCEQLKVLKKIRKIGKVNGFDMELAEAQAADYVSLRKRIDNIEADVTSIRTEQAVQGGKLDLIIQRLNSPVEKERAAGLAWLEVRSLLTSWKGWAIIIFFLMSVALAGDKILQLTGWLPTGA